MRLQVGRWTVRNVAMTAHGEMPLSELSEQDIQALNEKIYLAFARAMAPQGVQVRGVTLGRDGCENEAQAEGGQVA